MTPPFLDRKPFAAIVGALAALVGSAACAQSPLDTQTRAGTISPLHGSCARRAARVFADRVAAPLARQGRWIADIEQGRRASFRVVQEAVAPGRPLAETFVALLDYADSSEAARRYDDAVAAADAVRRRYLALVHLLDVVLPVVAFEHAAPVEVEEALNAGGRLLVEAVEESRGLRAALAERRLSAGVDYVDENGVRGALDEARGEYQRCVLAGVLEVDETGQAAPQAAGEASRCMLAVSGEPRPAALSDVFRPSGLLAAECGAVASVAPQIVAQVEALLEQRRQAREAAAAAAAAARPPAAAPERGPLSGQVLSPRQLRNWLGRAYASEMFCHREAASVYRAAMSPFIDAAEAVARATLDRELEARAARARVELERRLGGLDRVLESAVSIDDALERSGVRGVQNASTSLTNLTGGARNQRDAFERALAALDPEALEAERARRLDEIVDRYDAEHRRLAEWRGRFDIPPDPSEHPFVTGDSAGAALDFPYGVQYPDRALRNGVTGAANAANAHLNACRATNAHVAALVRPAPSSGVCDAWPPSDRFLQWGFVRAVERATVERCSVDLRALDGPFSVVPAPRDDAALARQEALAAQTAAAAPEPDLAATLARVDALTSEFNARLSEVERRLAAIRAKLEAQSNERLAAVSAPRAERASEEARAPAAPVSADPAAYEPPDPHAVCRAREAELRAAIPRVIGQTVFVRYDEEVLVQRWAERSRPDGRVNVVDSCQVVYCPAETRTYEECVAYTAANLTEKPKPPKGWEQIDYEAQWIVDNLLSGPAAAVERFYRQPQGDTVLERMADRAATLACTMFSMARGGRWLETYLPITTPCDTRLEPGGAAR